MESFKQVTVDKKANVYFEGKVTSRTLHFADGSNKTLGYMLPGEYEFNTGAPEAMEMLAGGCEVQLPGSDGWKKFSAGETFQVPGQAKFRVRVAQGCDYCCSFL